MFKFTLNLTCMGSQVLLALNIIQIVIMRSLYLCIELNMQYALHSAYRLLELFQAPLLWEASPLPTVSLLLPFFPSILLLFSSLFSPFCESSVEIIPGSHVLGIAHIFSLHISGWNNSRLPFYIYMCRRHLHFCC